MTDLDALLAEAELRAGDGRAWTGDFESLIEDSELVAALAAAVRDLRADRDALRDRLTNAPCVVDEHERLEAELASLRERHAAAFAMLREANEAFDECTGNHAKELVADEAWRDVERVFVDEATRETP